MGPPLQNLRTKGLMGKMFRNKELGEARRWRVEVFSAGCVEETLGTVPLALSVFSVKVVRHKNAVFFCGRLWKRFKQGRWSRRSLHRAYYAAAWALAFLSFTSASAPRRSA